MKVKSEVELRQEAIRRYLTGEKPSLICTVLQRTKPWFYKWLNRYRAGRENWFQEVSRRPRHHYRQTATEMEDMIVELRQELSKTLYAQIGALAIQWKMTSLGMTPLPISTINRILKRRGLIDKKTKYHPSGIDYPKVGMDWPNSVHQLDLVGPRYLHDQVRFYSFNLIDAYSHQISLFPCPSKGDTPAVEALIKAWKRIGKPDFLQVDNELFFRGSNRYPRSFGLVIRFCLSLGVQPVFIPQGEPWRQGVIEKFNDVYDKIFFRSQEFHSWEHLNKCSNDFESFHNQNHRYSALQGKTPNQIVKEQNPSPWLLESEYQLPNEKIPLESGYIHLIRFIRSDKILNIFGERFFLPQVPVYEYVTATICVNCHTIKIYQDNRLLGEIEYRLPVDW